MLVSVGAALFTIAGAFGVEGVFSDQDVVVRYDPTRVAAQIVTGIGFLGAGAIIQQGLSVRGLTTAASLWVTAAVGMSVGLGYYTGAAVTAVFTVLALYGMKRMRSVVFSRLRKGECRITVQMGDDLRLSQLVHAIEERGGRVESMKFAEEEGNGKQLTATVKLDSGVDPEDVVAGASDLPGVRAVDWYR